MAQRRDREAKSGGEEGYPWLVKGSSLLERKMLAEGRREELLTLLYQDKFADTEHVQELVREWIDLVTERDRLLREELQQHYKEEKEEYLRDLRMFLNHIPLAEQSFEEKQLKDCIRRLEKQVTNYCSTHNINVAPRRMAAWRSVPSGLERDVLNPSPYTATGANRQRVTTRSVSPTDGNESLNYTDGADATPQFPPPVWKRKDTLPPNTVVVEAVIECEIGNSPPPPPPPPAGLPPPPPPPPPPPLPTPLRPIMVGKGAANAAGTGQFVGRATYNQQQEGLLNTPPSSRSKAEKSFIDEISTVGQSKLKSTKRPRSPGGTPIKTPNQPAATSTPSANDIFQQALISRMKTLHSTPIRPKSGQRRQQSVTSDPNDISNQWSDVHSFEDPDYTTAGGDTTAYNTTVPASSPPSSVAPPPNAVASPSISEGFSPNKSKISTPKPRKGMASPGGSGGGTRRGWRNFRGKKGKKGQEPNPNTSTAV